MARDESSTTTAGAAADYVSRGYEQFNRGYGQVEQCVRQNPMSSALTVFGFGLGLGLVLGSNWGVGRYFRPADPGLAERLGQQVIEALAKVLPEQWAERLQA